MGGSIDCKEFHMRRWKKLPEDDSGVSTVEYALLLAMIILISVSTLGGLGVEVNNIYLVIDPSFPDR